MKQKIGLIDYGMGNLKSVFKAFEKMGAKCEIITSGEKLLKMDKAVLPGVGAIKDCMENLKRLELVEPIYEFISSGKYFLGICLGMQALLEKSFEFGEVNALGIIKGEVVKFENLGNLPIPHMGWNSIIIKKESPLFYGIKSGDFFYFAHSYYVKLKNKKENEMSETEYGIYFTSSINKDNVFGVQFHPEKSQKKGLQLIENFIKRLK